MFLVTLTVTVDGHRDDAGLPVRPPIPPPNPRSELAVTPSSPAEEDSEVQSTIIQHSNSLPVFEVTFTEVTRYIMQ